MSATLLEAFTISGAFLVHGRGFRELEPIKAPNTRHLPMPVSVALNARCHSKNRQTANFVANRSDWNRQTVRLRHRGSTYSATYSITFSSG